MKKLLFAIMGISALLLGSCSYEHGMTGEDGESIPAGMLRVSVNVPFMYGPNAIETRATIDAEPGEEEIGSLFLLFFEENARNEGEYVDYVEIDLGVAQADPLNPKWDIDMTGRQLDVTSPYHILAIANIHTEDYLNGMSASSWMLQWAGKNETEVIAEATAWTQAKSGTDKIAPNHLLMSGRTEKIRNQFDVTIHLLRNQARFDILNSVPTEYEVVEAGIYNVYPSSKIWNDGAENGALDFSDNIGRIESYYKYDNPSGNDIIGGLYVFENQVAMPSLNDRVTTNLILGLRKNGESTPTYYRANISPEDSAQILKRNNVYRLTINSVGGRGADTPADAYNFPNDNQLDYTINAWDLSDMGVSAQSPDGSSLLSSPYNKVTLPCAVDGPGNPSISFDLFTFSSKSPDEITPLEIIEQYYEYNGFPDNGILATRVGNKLTITATEIPSGHERTGWVKIGYAGLRITINVLQTDLSEEFLELDLPDGGIPIFAPFGGIQSGLVRVRASDEWTAVILSEDGSFSFSGSDPGATTIKSSDAAHASLLTDGTKFRVWTSSANPNNRMREAVIVVRLDKDPINYEAHFQVKQNVAAGIAIVPSHPVTFDGMGRLALIPDNMDDVFTIYPSIIDDIEFADWAYIIENDTNNAFAIDMSRTAKDLTNIDNPEGNKVAIETVDKNVSGVSYTAKLTVYLVSNPSVRASIDLIQLSEGIDLSPNLVPVIPKTGGESQLVSVKADASLKWKAKITTVSGTADGRRLVRHEAELLDQNGTPIDPNAEYSVATDKFKVRFPKIYYPNRQIPVSAEVEITIVGSALKKTITVTQATLNPAPMHGYAMTGSPTYGGLGDYYNRGWDGAGASHGGYGLAQIPDYYRLGVGSPHMTSISPSVNYLHVTPHIAGAAGTSYNWFAVNNYIAERDAWTVIQNQDNYGVNPVNNPNSPLKKAGYGNSVYGLDLNGHIYTGSVNNNSNKKVYKFMFENGHTTLTPAQITDYFYIDGVNTSIPITGIPDTGVILMVKEGEHANNAILVIDIKHKFLWIGESQLFWYDTYLTKNRGVFLDNLMYFVGNASKYGSHFTDLLLEEIPANPEAMPAPWDSYWDCRSTGGTDNRGVSK